MRFKIRVHCFLFKYRCWNQTISHTLPHLFKLLNFTSQKLILIKSIGKFQIIHFHLFLWENQSLIRKIIHLIDSRDIILRPNSRIYINRTISEYFYQTDSIFPTNKTGNFVEVGEICVAAIKLYYFSQPELLMKQIDSSPSRKGFISPCAQARMIFSSIIGSHLRPWVMKECVSLHLYSRWMFDICYFSVYGYYFEGRRTKEDEVGSLIRQALSIHHYIVNFYALFQKLEVKSCVL